MTTNLASEFASLATVIGVPVAIAAYWFNARAIRLTQMHKLFGDYLRMKFDHAAMEKPKPALRTQLSVFKFYTLEEMFLWVGRERRFAWFPSHKAALAIWEKTIDEHLEIEEFDNVEKMVRLRGCYEPDFFERWLKVNADHPSLKAAAPDR